MGDFLADSLAHPTLTGSWLGQPAGATFGALDAALRQEDYAFAAAVGMWGMDGYEAEAYARAVASHAHLVPIAGVKPQPNEDVRSAVGALKEMGYRGIKLHPRFSQLDRADPLLGAWMEEAGQQGLVTYWCTYVQTSIDAWPASDPFYDLVSQLKSAPHARVILLHGGDVELLRYMQLVRGNGNLLLDLSHTMAKYPGSSLEADCQFLCAQFDRHLCLGTDWPQFSHSQIRTLYERFTFGVPLEKRRNLGYRNLAHFLGVETDC